MTTMRAAQRRRPTTSTTTQRPNQRPTVRRAAPFRRTSTPAAPRWSGGLSVEQMSAERDAALRGNSAGQTGLVALLYAEAAETALLTHAEAYALLAAAQAGDRAARDQLVRANVRLAGRVAQWYLDHTSAGANEAQGIGRDDLVQDGILGLLRAIDGFDLSTGHSFSTYAVQWIRQAISRAIDDRGLTVRLPVYLRTRIRRVQHMRVELERRDGAPPSAERIAEALGLRVWMVEDALALSPYMRGALSLEYNLSTRSHGASDDPITFAEYLADPDADAALEAIEEDVDRTLAEQAPDSVTQIMARLKRRRRMHVHPVGQLRDVAREMEIVERRVLQGQTFDEIARALGLTRQRIQQLEKKGLEAIRAERTRVRRELARQQAQASGQPLPLRQQEQDDTTEREQRAKGA